MVLALIIKHVRIKCTYIRLFPAIRDLARLPSIKISHANMKLAAHTVDHNLLMEAGRRIEIN